MPNYITIQVLKDNEKYKIGMMTARYTITLSEMSDLTNYSIEQAIKMNGMNMTKLSQYYYPIDSPGFPLTINFKDLDKCKISLLNRSLSKLTL